jgi:tRNA (guanine-N7-)-methyltransferase
MSKRKLQRFAELNRFPNVIQPSFEEVFNKDYYLKGAWNNEFFKNPNPIILELGCGKGEYTIGLARHFPAINFIGVDIKGSRLWKGANVALQDNIINAAFLRTNIEFIGSFFNQDEINEIWLTFPDPQIKKKRKRLTSPRFLNTYSRFLKNHGIIHLKTDSHLLYEYTLNLVRKNGLNLRFYTNDLYNSGFDNELLAIKTYYEKQFLDQGLKINYLSFELTYEKSIEEVSEEEK